MSANDSAASTRKASEAVFVSEVEATVIRFRKQRATLTCIVCLIQRSHLLIPNVFN